MGLVPWMCSLVLIPLLWASDALSNDSPSSFCSSGSEDSFLDESPPPPCFSSNFNNFKKIGRSQKANAERSNGLIPTWIDMELARKGQKFALHYLTEIGTSHVYGSLLSTYPDGAFFMMFTGQCETVEKVAKRYLATMTQVLIWYQDPMFESNDSDIITSISRIRAIHTAAAEAGAEKQRKTGQLVDPQLWSDYEFITALSGPFSKDLNASEIPRAQRVLPPSHWTNFTNSSSFVPMNQQMAALTQYAFVGYPILFPERLGMSMADEDELWAFNHLWAVLGYALGLQDEYNIALQPDLDTGKAVYKQIWEKFNVPNLYNMDEKTIVLMEKGLLGFLAIAESPVQPNFFLYRMLTDLIGIEAPNTFKTLSEVDQLLASQRDVKLVPDHKATAVDDVVRDSLNIGLWSGIDIIGTKEYGPQYAERNYRAKNVYISQYA